MPENQDCLVNSVCITRGDIEGIYNAAQEARFEATSPTGTLWANGRVSDGIENLQFSNWVTWVAGNPPARVGESAVLYLSDADIYLDIVFTSWEVGRDGGGGGFSYRRSTPASVSSMAVAVPSTPLLSRLRIVDFDRSRWREPRVTDFALPT